MAAGAGPRLCLIAHHTDAVREWAYDRTSSIGHLDRALDEAQAKGWTVVDMKNDWKVIYPFEKKQGRTALAAGATGQNRRGRQRDPASSGSRSTGSVCLTPGVRPGASLW